MFKGFGIFANHTRISPDRTADATGGRAPYWHLGTQGGQDPNTKQYSAVDNAPDSLIQIYSIKARKGLPLDIDVAVGYLQHLEAFAEMADCILNHPQKSEFLVCWRW